MREGLMMDDYQLTLTAAVERAQLLTPDQEIVSRAPDGAVSRTTFAQAIQRARRAATALTALGVGDGDPVATLMWNQPEHIEMYVALPAMGAVLHTLNPRLHPDELAFIAADAGDKAIIVDETLLDVLESFSDRHAFDHVIVVTRPTHPTRSLPDGAHDYEQLIADAQPMDPWPPTGERAAAAICYTSGTTGRPKGVVYSHRALVLHSLVLALPDAKNLSREDSILPVVPMFHANAWGLIYAATMIGARLVLPGPRLDAVSVLDLLADERVTVTAGVPTVWMAVLDALDTEPRRWDLSRLRHLVVGGAAAPVSLLEGFDRHGLTVICAWG